MRCTDKNKTQFSRFAEADASRPSGYTEREWARVLQRERAEKLHARKLLGTTFLLLLAAALMAFLVYYFVLRSHDYTLYAPYDRSDPVLSAGSSFSTGNMAEPFAADLCVASGDTNITAVTMNAYSAGLFDLNGKKTVYAKDIFAKRSPASITKVMTALVALKYGNLDDLVTVTATVKDIETGSSVCDIHEGDVLSLRQLLYGLLIASGNDAAMMIAEHVGGSVERFVALMNQEALALGATSTHFTNPHGLTDAEHYTSVYDIYLMFRAAMEYNVFQDIISRKNYYAEYTRGDGSSVAVTWESTNHYFTGEAEAPDNILVYGGKTGTTDDAGACLALLAKDLYGNPYLSVILHAGSKDTLYEEMNQLLLMME